MEKILQIKPYIRSIRRVPELRQFPHFKQIMSDWEKILVTYYPTYIEFFKNPLNQHLRDETYTLTVDFGSETLCFTWNIDKMAAYIEEGNVPAAIVSVKSILRSAVYKKELRKDFIPQRPDNPIILIRDIFGSHSLLCINGNHRLNQSNLDGEDSRRVFIFEGEDHTTFLMTPFEKLFWKFTADVLRITDYVINNPAELTAEETASYLYIHRLREDGINI